MNGTWPLAALTAGLMVMSAPAALAADREPPRAAGWQGREIRVPRPPQNDRTVARFPRGWSPGSVGPGGGGPGGRGPRPAAERPARRAVPAWRVRGQRGAGGGVVAPGGLATRARGAVAVAPPRLPAGTGRRPLRPAHARRRAVVPGQARA